MAKPNPNIERQALRARRSRIGSNERRKCLGHANLLSACVHEIDADKKLAKHVAELAAAGSGWRTVADAVIAFVRKRDAKKAKVARV